MASLEKWVDELQIALDNLTKRVANAVASAFKPEITTPTDGQVIMYDSTAEAWKNGDVFSPEITEPTDGQAIVYDATAGKWVNADVQSEAADVSTVISRAEGVSTIETPIKVSPDNVTTVIIDQTKGQLIRLKSGAGSFVSYFYTDGVLDLTDISTADIDFTAMGAEQTASVDLSSLSGTFHVGAYYEATSQYFEVGVGLFYENMPFVLAEKIQALRNSAQSGTIDIEKLIFNKAVTRKRRKTK